AARTGGRGSGALVPAVDLQAPRQVGPGAVQLVVEVVAPATDRLGKDNAGRSRVGVVQEANSAATTADPGPHGAERHGSPDTETAIPDLERVQGMGAAGEVELPAGDHVVEPAADDPERNGPHRHIQRLTRLTASLLESSLGDPDRHDDAGEDEHRVGPDGKRSDEPDRLLRARDRRDHFVAAVIAATRAAGVVRFLVMSVPLSLTVGVLNTPAFSPAVCT